MALVRFDRSLALASVATLALVCSLSVSRPARALDDDGKQNVFNALLGMIDVKPHEGPDIDYRERPKLVLPPKMDLPPPGRPDSLHTAGWPNDPDVLRRKKEAEEAKAPIIGLGYNDSTRPLTKDQLLSNRGPAVPPPAPASDYSRCSHGQCDWVQPQILQQEGADVAKAKGAAEDDQTTDIVTAGHEPPRKYLTDPPTGYRKATATVKAPPSQPAVVQGNSDNIANWWSNINPFKGDDDE
jgi:hypothetical protein